MTLPPRPLIESDTFDFEFLSRIGEVESWRKEVHRPVYHVHKWWAKRLGSVFRGILLGSLLPDGESVEDSFYKERGTSKVVVLDPFLGSGTTVGEAHKLGLVALGRDINPVAVQAARVAFGPLDRGALSAAFTQLERTVGVEIRKLYQSVDRHGRPCDVLYWFWVMQAPCPDCREPVDLFDSRVFSRHAYPKKVPEVQVCCPGCGDVFQSDNRVDVCRCPACSVEFRQSSGTTARQTATCTRCNRAFKIVDAIRGQRPHFRMYAKMVLSEDGVKEYLPATKQDAENYRQAAAALSQEVLRGSLTLPTLQLAEGHNTSQAIRYGFVQWRDFFNERQLLALGQLQRGISRLEDPASRDALMTLFSGVLEFNNMFASFKGEGTGAVRHMFAHHILKPERMPIEANPWGTPKSSGAFSTLYNTRLLRALEYRERPTEVTAKGEAKVVASQPFSGHIGQWPSTSPVEPRGLYLSCGDSATTGLPDRSVDLVVTDPPFFDNVHYSELADFFHAWQPGQQQSTRNEREVQDVSAEHFSRKLRDVFSECARVMKDDGLLVFTYHHSRTEGWASVAAAIVGAGMRVVNSHPVKSEMSVATPKAAASDPINIDIVVVCRKLERAGARPLREQAHLAAKAKIDRMEKCMKLSINDRRVITFGQLLSTVETLDDARMLSLIEDPKPPITPPSSGAGPAITTSRVGDVGGRHGREEENAPGG